MSCTLKESFERSCRLCAEEQEVTIMIFSQEAEAMLLQNKLIQYLLIEIDENDCLPKNICIRCCSKLHTVCEFIDTARKSQQVLLSRSVLLGQMETEDPCEVSLTKTEIMQEKGTQYFENGEAVTQMEISIDPMMILQHDDGYTVTPEPDEHPPCGEEMTYLHGLESENVTIKLIKKDQREEQSEPKLNEVGSNFKPFQCFDCKRSFLTELALKNHSWIHHNEDKIDNKFNCNMCSENFDFKSDLIAHLKEHRDSVTCKVCGRVFRSEENLALHMESHRRPSQAFICKVCGRAYNTSSNLKTHSITHSNERPYQCHLCKKSFKRNQDLKFHINQHTGARPYKCPYCDKSFASSGNCYSHRNRMHPGRRDAYASGAQSAKLGWRRQKHAQIEVTPSTNGVDTPAVRNNIVAKFKCRICGHGFVKKENLTYHMYQHTGHKSFQCSHCPEKFVTRNGMAVHYDRKHPGRERPLALLSKNMLLA